MICQLFKFLSCVWCDPVRCAPPTLPRTHLPRYAAGGGRDAHMYCLAGLGPRGLLYGCDNPILDGIGRSQCGRLQVQSAVRRSAYKVWLACHSALCHAHHTKPISDSEPGPSACSSSSLAQSPSSTCSCTPVTRTSSSPCP